MIGTMPVVDDGSADGIQVLLVEDDANDVDLIRRALARFKGARFVLSAVDRVGSALAYVATRQPDVVVLDMTLPDGSGLSLLSMVLRSLAEIPVVVLTCSSDATLPLAAVKMGAQDFLQKEHILLDERLPRALLYAIERRRWHEQIERSQLQLEEAQAITKVGSWDWDLKTDQVTLSRELRRICGLDERQSSVDYEAFLALVHPEERGRADQCFRSAAGSLMPFTCEYRVVLPDGQTRSLLGRGRAHTDAGGQVQRLSGSAQDITERKEIEAQLQVAGRMAAVGTLASGVAHEINNPLASILGNLEYLSRQLAADGVDGLREVVAETRESARRIRDVVKNLMLFSEASGEAAVDVRRLLDAVLDVVGNELRERAHVTREYEEIPRVVANEGRLAHAFVQLLLNAAQAIPPGAPGKHEIRIRTARARDGRVVVEIRDDGEGIPAAIRAKIFDPFFTTRPLGTAIGLGLSTAHAIVSAAGGSIALDSEVGEGSTFRVLLPAGLAASEPSSGSDGGQRVLIVDDDPQVGQMLRRLLAREYHVSIATDAASALAQTANAQFDVILCDLMMPEVSGIDFFERLSRSSPDSAARIIFMTAGACTDRMRSFLETVNTTCLRKPFEPEALFEAVRACVERRHGPAAA
jgi:PAS domain S-box-containing protein